MHDSLPVTNILCKDIVRNRANERIAKGQRQIEQLKMANLLHDLVIGPDGVIHEWHLASAFSEYI
jgi:hypothetical protein